MRWLLVIFGLVLILGQDCLAVDKAKLRWARRHPVIDSIQITGNFYIEDSEVKQRMYSRTRNAWLSIKGDRRSRIQRETLGRDTLEIKYLYLSNGFLDVVINHSYVPLGDDSTAKAVVLVEIAEGQRYRYGDIDVRGTFPGKFYGRFRSLANRLRRGAPVNPLQLNATEVGMKTELANGGYPYATVHHFVDKESDPDACKVLFAVESDSLVHFGEVHIEGDSVFPAYAARRELKIATGEVYRRDDILESQRRLFESGYYSTFQLNRTKGSLDRLNPDFALKLRERKPRQVTFKAGAGQSRVRDLQWDFSGAYGKLNFLGSRRYDLLADYSFSLGKDTRIIKHRYRARITEPWFLGVRMPVALTGEVQPRTRDIEQVFKKRSWSISLDVYKWYTRKVRANIGVEYQYVKITGIPADSVDIVRRLAGNSARRKMYFRIRRDSRDDIFVPHRGSVTEISAEYFGGFMGGDDSFYKFEASWSRYRKVWPGWISATRLKGGMALEFGETESVPLDEAIYVGGANTVRGFEENKLGPLRDDGTPLGTRYNIVFNQEFRWKTVQFLNPLPVIGRLMSAFPLWQTLFLDVGNGFAGRSEISFDNLAVAYGSGIQIMSPAGPIRLDYARVVATEHFPMASRWHFTILYAF